MITKKLIKIFGVAGAGKTTECVKLIKELLDSGYNINQIACVSFSKESVRTMIEKLKYINVILSNKKDHYFRTLNSITWQLCNFQETVKERERDDFLEKNGIATKKDDEDSKTEKEIFLAAYSNVVNSCADFITNCDKTKAFRLINEYLSENSSDEIELDTSHLLNIMYEYEKWKREKGVWDYDDSLIQSIKKEYDIGVQIKVLIIDEAQDLGFLQQQIIRLWTQKYDKEIVILAGDDDQTIHAWRGASSTFLINYSDKGLLTEKIILERSYRLPQKIASFCNDILSTINEREKKVIIPDKTGGIVRFIYEEELTKFINKGVVDKKRIFVLCRTNKIRKEFGDSMFSASNIPFNFFKTESKSKWSTKFIAVSNALNKIKNGQELLKYEVKQLLSVLPASCLVRGRKTEFKELKDKDMTVSDTISTNDFLSLTQLWNKQRILHNVFYQDIKLNIVRYISWMQESQDKQVRENEMYRNKLMFIQEVFDLAKTDTGWFFEPNLRIGTFHDSKGGEADHVFVLMGTSFAFREIDDNERRVFYVACSRAKEQLFLVDCFAESHKNFLVEEFKDIIDANLRKER